LASFGARSKILIPFMTRGSSIEKCSKFRYNVVGSGPVGPRSDIASKSGFFARLGYDREAKKVSAM
jgi:hypothetical protein